MKDGRNPVNSMRSTPYSENRSFKLGPRWTRHQGICIYDRTFVNYGFYPSLYCELMSGSYNVLVTFYETWEGGEVHVDTHTLTKLVIPWEHFIPNKSKSLLL